MHGIAYRRLARVYPERLPEQEIVLVSPPQQPAAPSGFMAILPMLVPVLGALGSVSFLLVSLGNRSGAGGGPLIPILMGSTMTLSIGAGILMNVMQRRGQRAQQRTTRERYSRYLDQQAARLDDIARRQRAAGDHVHPDAAMLAGLVARRERVWERRPGDADFLHVRVGSGPTGLVCPVRVDAGANPLADPDPDLLARAHGVVARFAQVEGVPVAVPLPAYGVVTVGGAPEQARALVRGMLAQVIALHAPDDVRILVYAPREVAPAWAWAKWPPHARRLRRVKAGSDGGEQLAMLADSPAALHELLTSQVLPELQRRDRLASEKQHGGAPPAGTAGSGRQHLLVVVDGCTRSGLPTSAPAFVELLAARPELGITTLCLVADRGDEPASVGARLDLSGGLLTVEEARFGGQRREGITPDGANTARSDEIARGLAPLTLGERGDQRDLADDVPLLELLGLPTPDAVSTEEQWATRPRADVLRVPIGVAANGEPLLLDLKEAAEGGMGPHGLIIGATGSGKSELLRTIVTSLAVRHDPETVNFVLADFKGGASFADLARLPHVAGMITNLQADLTLVDRMRAALFGEQERRQRLLREAGNLDNIQQYLAARAAQPSLAPMPHLLIIVDEFAELLASRPDFLELFVAIGRVGRSLGMHLLLATQRLGEGRIQGLEGHLRYRICLRTFSAAESSAVIGTPDAFYLPSYPGIGYFKVDTTVYRQFKSATVSTPYIPAAQNAANAAIRLFTDAGRLVPVRPAVVAVATDALPAGDGRTDMDVIIARLGDGAEAHAAGGASYAVHQVWLPPLPVRVGLGDVLRRGMPHWRLPEAWTAPGFGALHAPVGLLDRPADQAQDPCVLDFSGAGGHLVLVGAPQSGKSTFLVTLLAGFLATHSPRDVQAYCIDLGGGLLRALEDAPHVGAVCGKSDRDKIRRTIRQVRTIIEERELLFARHRIEGAAAFRARRQAGEFDDQPFGDVFLVVDNIGLLQAEFDGLDAELVDIAATGLTYGVHVIATANRWAEVRPKLRDNIGTRLELRLNDPMESELGKATALLLSAAPPGRGASKGGLQFQIALPGVGEGSTGGDGAAALVAAARAAWEGPPAPEVLLLPMVLAPEELPAPAAGEPAGTPIGVEEFRLAPMYVDLSVGAPHFLIFGDGESGKTSLLRGWIRGLGARLAPEAAQFVVVDFRRGLLETIDDPHLLAYACTAPMLKDAIDKLKTALDTRIQAAIPATLEDLRHPSTWDGPHYYLFVDDYEAIVPPSGNPLQPLLDHIQQGRDIGFHVVVARKVAGASRTAFEPVSQRLKESGSAGLILSGESQEGALLGTQRASAQPAGRGYLVRRNQRTVLVQTAYTPAPVPDAAPAGEG